MQKRKTWYELAANAIRVELVIAGQLGLDESATLARVDSAYPFGVRAYYPYKAWLKARRDLVTGPMLIDSRDREKLRQWNAGEYL